MPSKLSPSDFWQSGQAALIATILILGLAVGIALSLSAQSIQNVLSYRQTVNSLQSYYVAEAGIEDSLLRVTHEDMDWQPTNTLTLNSHTAALDIDQLGRNTTITSTGDAGNNIRRLTTGLEKNTTGGAFFYGVQVGEGGLEIRHNDGQVVGNVFANGTSFGSGEITGSMTVAGNGNEIQDLDVGGDVNAYTCADATIVGSLTHNTAGSNTCSVSGTVQTTTDEIEPLPFPISNETISEWKQDAADGGVISGDYTVTENSTLGPAKIDGNLYVSNNVTLTITGTLWVTGTFSNGNNAIVQLDAGYGDESGVLVFDGTVDIANNGILRGTSSETSYLLVVSTSNSLNEATPATSIKNNLAGAILFTPNGLTVVHNNAGLVEITAYKLLLHKATITYESGLENLTFSSGPSGGWTFGSWKEID